MTDLAGYRSYWSMAEKKGYSGVATYTKAEPLAVATNFGSPTLDTEGRVVHTEYPDFHLFNGYFPNSGMGPERLAHKMKFYDEFLDADASGCARAARASSSAATSTPRTPRSTSRAPRKTRRAPGFLPIEREWVTKLVAHGYHDTFRIFVAEPGHYTWWDMKIGCARPQYRLAHRLLLRLGRAARPRQGGRHHAARPGLGPLPHHARDRVGPDSAGS